MNQQNYLDMLEEYFYPMIQQKWMTKQKFSNRMVPRHISRKQFVHGSTTSFLIDGLEEVDLFMGSEITRSDYIGFLFVGSCQKERCTMFFFRNFQKNEFLYFSPMWYFEQYLWTFFVWNRRDIQKYFTQTTFGTSCIIQVTFVATTHLTLSTESDLNLIYHSVLDSVLRTRTELTRAYKQSV